MGVLSFKKKTKKHEDNITNEMSPLVPKPNQITEFKTCLSFYFSISLEMKKMNFSELINKNR